MRAHLAIAGALVALTGCGNVYVGTPSARTVPIRFAGTPRDATVLLDDQRVGSLDLVATRGVRVLPGKHHLTIEAPGYLPYDAVLDAKDEVVRVDARLVPVPD